jgi:hypothetical protein
MPIASKSLTKNERVVEVPVLPYVAAVMRTIYGNGVIPANHNTLIGKAIASCFIEIPDELPFPERPCHYEKIELSLNYRIARFYKKWNLQKAFDIGAFYEKTIQRMMFVHILAQVRCGSSINAAIDDFFEIYGISEDDYARATALMMYHNYIVKMNLKPKKLKK